MVFDASSQRVAPFIKFIAGVRDSINSIFCHQGMSRFFCSVRVKFFFEKSVYGTVQTKRKTRRTADSKSFVQIKTSWALHEKINTASADHEWLLGIGTEKVSGFLRIVI